jgi:CDP-paratose 2-epimerase
VSDTSRILITGGAGFVGSSLAIALAGGGHQVTAFDNLRRRGSELALARLRAAGVRFQHGDIRSPSDLAEAPPFELMIECSAEPSVHAGYDGGADYLVQTNLVGTWNCLEAARRARARFLFLSTSRVYPIAGLTGLPLERRGERFALPDGAQGPGWSAAGIASGFPLRGARSLYGATKLASELLIEEYRAMYGLRAIVNRCGVLTGPWQMGKVDQGFLVLWAARHLYGGKLAYLGFGGEGLQVRDVLHVADLHALIERQLAAFDALDGSVFNVGGGPEISVSLRELTAACAERAGRRLAIGSDPATRPADVPWYVTDDREVAAATGWRPTRGTGVILDEVFAWLRDYRAELEPVLSLA